MRMKGLRLARLWNAGLASSLLRHENHLSDKDSWRSLKMEWSVLSSPNNELLDVSRCTESNLLWQKTFRFVANGFDEKVGVLASRDGIDDLFNHVLELGHCLFHA